ncbi:MAG: C-GCAxxG-C-C family protein [Gammaproteobacteria bacterium]|nr:C-GCAxxG-C-C family protein [Gammaproteobacteria bacterium]
MNIKDLSNVKLNADENFSAGLYCAESVLLTIADAYDIETELFPKIATAFCSGMSRTCGTCGALTGGILGISSVHGRTGAAESVEKVYKATQELIAGFESEFGSKNCHQLLGCDLGTPEGQETFRKEGLNSRCHAYTIKAAELAVEIIEKYNKVE